MNVCLELNLYLSRSADEEHEQVLQQSMSLKGATREQSAIVLRMKKNNFRSAEAFLCHPHLNSREFVEKTLFKLLVHEIQNHEYKCLGQIRIIYHWSYETVCSCI
eukprot:TRINITY_DN11220_c0_g1_i3.p1 TRINITY_DN11220_c0_g1~~TRINITY_DN11220_c0_g1_i3.p1  ORF type:complete len:105 (+),score=18.88 TRINITY_DN11220_c0_g1_i3:1164-1478(+)